MSKKLSASSNSIYPFYFNWLLILLMITIVIISLVASYHSYLGKHDWLQRSGSLIVVIAVIMEYMHLKIFDKAGTQSSVLNSSLSFKGSKLITNMYNSVWKVNYILLILGTVVWGYGDIPFWPES